MCTVTFVPSGTGFLFTSNRDEWSGRPAANPPRRQVYNGQHLLFPRDPVGGGSWIVLNENGNLAVLLNGALQPHLVQPPYRKSRGTILLDLISRTSPSIAFEEIDLTGVEPFTVILFEDEKLWSGIWNGTVKTCNELNSCEPRIWSSVTLYDVTAKKKREGWFKKWLSENPNPHTQEIVGFHRQGGDGDPNNDMLMNRKNQIFTNSISSIELTHGTGFFYYQDLRNGQESALAMPVQHIISQKA